MAVIDIRGTHGSGKSWVMHKLITLCEAQPILDDDGAHLGYHLDLWDAALLGNYKNECGGCDGIKTADEVCRRVRKFHKEYTHVLLEGILVAHTFKRYHELAVELGDYVFCFLDTSLARCIRRVKGRRLRRGNDKPLNTSNLERDYESTWGKLRHRMAEEGHRVIVLPWEDPIPPILRLLEE